MAGDLVSNHNHTRAGHGCDARVAAQSDGHTIVVIRDHGMGQDLLLGHSHLTAVEKDHATPKEYTNQSIQLGRRQGCARASFQQTVGLQIALLDLQATRLGRPR